VTRFESVPARTRKNIESYGLAVVSRAFPKLVESPNCIPIAEFLEFDLGYFAPGIEVRFGSLPSPTEAVTIPSSAPGQPIEIIFDEEVIARMVDLEGRARFTGAHELYHGLVHANELKTKLSDGPRPEGLYRVQDVPRYCDPEWQANVFAGAFLMPEPAVRAFHAECGRHIYLMMDLFKVSKMVATVRLDKLGLD